MGKWAPGSSGNPVGRPKSAKNQITTLKQNLEIALRENVQPEQIQAIVDSMVLLAIGGNVGAGKLILDKVLSNAKVEEDTDKADNQLVIRVQNATFKVEGAEENDIIDVTPEETPMSTGAKESNQNGPASGGASGPAGTPNAPARPVGSAVGDTDGKKPSDGQGGK